MSQVKEPSVHGLDVAQMVGIVVAAFSTVVTSALARQMFTDIEVFTDDADAKEGEDSKKRKRAKAEDTALRVIYMFALAFLIVYVGYIGYKEGIANAAGTSSLTKATQTSLKDYGTAMVVLAYFTIVMLILTSSMGIDMYKGGKQFGTNVDEDNPDGDKKGQAQALYGTYIAMIVIAVIAFVLLTAYLADAAKHGKKFYDSYLSSAFSSGGGSSGMSSGIASSSVENSLIS